jgi:hypothetical protein
LGGGKEEVFFFLLCLGNTVPARPCPSRHRRPPPSVVDCHILIPIRRVYWQALGGDSRPELVTASPKHPGRRRQ